MQFKFSLPLFYKLGMVCFMIIVFGNSFSLFMTWPNLNTGLRISNIAGICFNILLVIFFNYLRKTAIQPEKTAQQLISNEDILKVIEKMK